MTDKSIVLGANMLIRAVLGQRVRELILAHAATVQFFAPDVAVHGFCGTFRTWDQEPTAYPEDGAELSFADDNSDATRAAYVCGELVEKRRSLMADWAKFCETGSTWTGGNVVAIGDISQ